MLKTKQSQILTAFAAVLALSTSAVAAEAPAAVKVGGFVDAQGYFNNDSSKSEGWVVNDGALYISKEHGAASFMLDIPFNSRAAGAALSLGGGSKAQAYVGYKTDMGLKFKLGQFDTIYGFEVNDTSDVTFSRQGLIYSLILPVTHTGVLASYEIMGMVTLNVMVADPYNNSKLSSTTGTNMEYGFQLTAAPSNFRFGAGMLMGKDPALTTESTSLIDLMAGATFDKLAIDLEYDIAKKAGLTEAGSGLLVEAVYGITDMISAGARWEMTKNVYNDAASGHALLATGATDIDNKQMALTVGPQFKLTDDFKVKVDYTYMTDKSGPTAALTTDSKSHSYAVAGVYKF